MAGYVNAAGVEKIAQLCQQLVNAGGIVLDQTPTQNSTNAVESGGVYTALQGKQDAITAGTGLEFSGDTLNHSNSVTAGTIGSSSASSGATIAVPYATFDAQGHIKTKGTHTHTIDDLPANKISGMADHIVSYVRRTSFATIGNSTSAYSSAGAAGWSYHSYESGIVHAWGIVDATSIAITTEVTAGNGHYYRTAADRHLRLPVAMSYIESLHFGWGMGGGALMGITASPSGDTTNWQSGTLHSIPFRFISLVSSTSGSSKHMYVPVEIWGVKAS